MISAKLPLPHPDTRHFLPVDQDMFCLGLEKFTQQHSPEDLVDILNQAWRVKSCHGERSANQYLYDAIGGVVRSEFDEAYYAQALHYHMALAYAYANNPKKMARHMGLSKTMPAQGGDLTFSSHVNLSRLLNAQQAQAHARGLPPILLASMPRSASATLTNALASHFGMPSLRVSAGMFPHYSIAPSWLHCFMNGGGVLHDHFSASKFNINLLNNYKIHDIFVLVRDPRAAAFSLAKKIYASSVHSQTLPELFENYCFPRMVAWLNEWFDCADQPEMNISWITYKEICRDTSSVIHRIKESLQAQYPALLQFPEPETNAVFKKHNFSLGDDNAWRKIASKETQARMWHACSDKIRNLLGLMEG